MLLATSSKPWRALLDSLLAVLLSMLQAISKLNMFLEIDPRCFTTTVALLISHNSFPIFRIVDVEVCVTKDPDLDSAARPAYLAR